ncbi:MAG: hypothetical protein FWG68_11180 [Defluviitaleaceae bacterium]|nr:hypothetical protein [Defluviitaleaceae bacterium]
MRLVLGATGDVFVGANVHLHTLLLNHWGLDGRATEDGRPYNMRPRSPVCLAYPKSIPFFQKSQKSTKPFK